MHKVDEAAHVEEGVAEFWEHHDWFLYFGWEEGVQSKLWREVTDLVILGSHEVSEIEPYPEEVKHYSEVKWLLKQKGYSKACYDVELRQDWVRNLDGTTDERNSGIELPLGNLILKTWHVGQRSLPVGLLAQAK